MGLSPSVLILNEGATRKCKKTQNLSTAAPELQMCRLYNIKSLSSLRATSFDSTSYKDRPVLHQ